MRKACNDTPAQNEISKKRKNEVASYFSLGVTVFEVNLEDFLHSL